MVTAPRDPPIRMCAVMTPLYTAVTACLARPQRAAPGRSSIPGSAFCFEEHIMPLCMSEQHDEND